MSDSKPYRSGPISYTPTAADIMQLRQQSGMPVTMCRDALAAEDGHQGRAAEWLKVESAKRWPDGGPHRHDIDWLPEKPSNVELVEADIPAIGDDLTFTAHRWLQGDPIPYDEMRRLCGLPDVSAYIARRELARMGRELREGFRRFGEAWAEAAEQALPGLRAISDAAKPKQAPPIWAQNPAGQHRPTKTRNHRRVK